MNWKTMVVFSLPTSTKHVELGQQEHMHHSGCQNVHSLDLLPIALSVKIILPGTVEPVPKGFREGEVAELPLKVEGEETGHHPCSQQRLHQDDWPEVGHLLLL